MLHRCEMCPCSENRCLASEMVIDHAMADTITRLTRAVWAAYVVRWWSSGQQQKQQPQWSCMGPAPPPFPAWSQHPLRHTMHPACVEVQPTPQVTLTLECCTVPPFPICPTAQDTSTSMETWSGFHPLHGSLAVRCIRLQTALPLLLQFCCTCLSSMSHCAQHSPVPGTVMCNT